MTDSTKAIDLTPLIEDMMIVIDHLNELSQNSTEEAQIDFETDALVVASALEFVQFLASMINGTLEEPTAK